MELFLLCSEDAESDVRMVADECLNKVIKVRTFMYCATRFYLLLMQYPVWIHTDVLLVAFLIVDNIS